MQRLHLESGADKATDVSDLLFNLASEDRLSLLSEIGLRKSLQHGGDANKR